VKDLQYYLSVVIFLATGICLLRSSVHYVRFVTEWEKHEELNRSNLMSFFTPDIPEPCRIHRRRWIKATICAFCLIMVEAAVVAVPTLLGAP
jgi:hypothetical protein